MKKYMLYIFESGRLVGMQDVTGWPVDKIDEAISALEFFGRTGEVSDKGRAICWEPSCGIDLGEREIPAGELSHGICPEHEAEKMAELGEICDL
uniref:Uncharacterized protein n=1 Tax=viral metagenome TaxID=1070528 RepID=A0A6H1ZGU4_9ZZZZ